MKIVGHGEVQKRTGDPSVEKTMKEDQGVVVMMKKEDKLPGSLIAPPDQVAGGSVRKREKTVGALQGGNPRLQKILTMPRTLSERGAHLSESLTGGAERRNPSPEKSRKEKSPRRTIGDVLQNLTNQIHGEEVKKERIPQDEPQ